MKKMWLVMLSMIVLLLTEVQAQEDCIPRKELMDKHVVTYLSFNGTIRGCVVDSGFYTLQHKKGRGRLSRQFIISICEGEPRTSPRVGDSFEICSSRSKPKKVNPEED